MGALLLRSALAGLVMAAAVLAPNFWVAHSARAHAYADASTAPARSIAIVPGAAVFAGHPLSSLAGRLQTALSLYERGRVKAILVSGNDIPTSREVPVMQQWLLGHGVPADDILVDPRGTRTRNTMLDAAGQFGIDDAIICTQSLYVERAVYLAQQAGIDAVGIGVPSAVSRSPRNIALETFKKALAFYESQLREGPMPAGPGQGRIAVAFR